MTSTVPAKDFDVMTFDVISTGLPAKDDVRGGIKNEEFEVLQRFDISGLKRQSVYEL